MKEKTKKQIDASTKKNKKSKWLFYHRKRKNEKVYIHQFKTAKKTSNKKVKCLF